MIHKPIKKEIKEQVYEKYEHHCAYCGCELEYKDMQVDHIKSLYWNSILNKYDPNLIQDDSIENLMPSCRKCNYYKSEGDIEHFRGKLKDILERTCRDSFQVQLAMKYGMLEFKPWDGIFYFEKCKENKH